jgi:K+-sensing histidine kinase KdpD
LPVSKHYPTKGCGASPRLPSQLVKHQKQSKAVFEIVASKSRYAKKLRVEDLEGVSSATEITVLRETLKELSEAITTEQSRRDAFIAALVHDLKTPLVATVHLLAMIEENDHLAKEERIKIIGSLHLEIERLIDLVQKMVDAYKYKRKNVKP